MRIEELETPAIVVDLDVLQRNIRSLGDYCRGSNLNLRPHTKTHKIPEIAQMQVEAGCHGITVAKVGEAEVMAAAGMDDILVHYPVIGQSKLSRLALLARDRKITVAVDSAVTAQAISAAAIAAGSTIHLLVEFDSGMHRCGVASADEVSKLAQGITRLSNVTFAGITTFPGHIWAEPMQQAGPLAEVSAMIGDIKTGLQRSGISCEIVSAGSTPTARNSHIVEGLTETRPGTYVFNDRNTAGVGACTWDDCALQVLVTVVSTAVHGRAIVDGGSKTFSADRWLAGEKTGFGHILEHPGVEFTSMSEEHGHLNVGASEYSPKIGDRLTIIPNHVCPCVNMHDTIHFHRDGVVEGYWQVAARGKIR
jgi:D-serine deaminase-like pyridoxal phosphate-dependent protein